MTPLDRRQFLSACAAAPLLRMPPAERSLVLIQLSGGNDGLSTVVPFEDDAYRRARTTIRLERAQVLPLADGIGLHGGLTGLARLFEEGRLGIVQGLGYPEMVRSHFKALEIWHTADPRGRAGGDGWIGRLAGGAGRAGSPAGVVHLGTRLPWSLHSSARPAVVVESPSRFRWLGGREEERALGGLAEEESPSRPGDPLHRGRDRALAGLRAILGEARGVSAAMVEAARAYRPTADYPRTPLAAGLRDAAALLTGGLGTRIVSLEMTGFDTHAAQRGQHDRLMAEFDGALTAFLEDMGSRPVLVLAFSEFGRRLAENASAGTDHGHAGPAFLLGPPGIGGLHGEHPDLEKLVQGDPDWTTDFRSLYGEVLEGWLGVAMEEALGKRYPRLGIFPPR